MQVDLYNGRKTAAVVVLCCSLSCYNVFVSVVQ